MWRKLSSFQVILASHSSWSPKPYLQHCDAANFEVCATYVIQLAPWNMRRSLTWVPSRITQEVFPILCIWRQERQINFKQRDLSLYLQMWGLRFWRHLIWRMRSSGDGELEDGNIRYLGNGVHCPDSLRHKINLLVKRIVRRTVQIAWRRLAWLAVHWGYFGNNFHHCNIHP